MDWNRETRKDSFINGKLVYDRSELKYKNREDELFTKLAVQTERDLQYHYHTPFTKLNHRLMKHSNMKTR